MPTVVQLPAGKAFRRLPRLTPQPDTVRRYSTGVGKIAQRIGEVRPLGSVADDETGKALDLLCGAAAVNTWNARRAAVLSWLGWCAEYSYDGPTVPA